MNFTHHGIMYCSKCGPDEAEIVPDTREYDYPQHCYECGAFLGVALTAAGFTHAEEIIRIDCEHGCFDSEAIADWAPYYEIELPAEVGRTSLANVTPGDPFTLFEFSGRLVAAWGRGLDDQLEVAADWLKDRAPGLFRDEEVAEEYARAIADGKTEDEADEIARADMTYTESGYLAGWEWTIVAKNPRPQYFREISGT